METGKLRKIDEYIDGLDIWMKARGCMDGWMNDCIHAPYPLQESSQEVSCHSLLLAPSIQSRRAYPSLDRPSVEKREKSSFISRPMSPDLKLSLTHAHIPAWVDYPYLS